jgi:hypothetical protein
MQGLEMGAAKDCSSGVHDTRNPLYLLLFSSFCLDTLLTFLLLSAFPTFPRCLAYDFLDHGPKGNAGCYRIFPFDLHFG